MNTIPLQVTCAIIENEVGQVLVAQRGPRQQLAGKWEFPGGKIEAGERAEDCIKREIKEELALDISVGKRLQGVIHHYDTKSICLIPFICHIVGGEVVLSEHAAVEWVAKERLGEVDFAAADIHVLTVFLSTVDL